MPRLRPLVFAALLGLPLAAVAADWAQYLGPNRNGVSAETGLHLDWAKAKPAVAWKVELGSGYASLAVAGDRLVTGAQRGDRDFIVCLATKDGRERWAFDAAPSYTDRQRQGSGPRGTPTVVGDKVYALLPRGELYCLTLADGKEVWKTNVFREAKAKDREGDTYWWGLSQSPLVEGDAVIVQPGGAPDGSVAAFHKDTGKLLWAAGGDPAGYGSAVAIDAAGRRQVVAPTGNSLLGLDPAKGTVLWRYAFGNRIDVSCVNPVWTGDTLFMSAAYGAGSAALELARDGDKVVPKERWRNKNLQALMATPVVHGGHVYGCHGDIGAMFLKCVDLKTGDVRWQERVGGRVGFVAAEGHLLCLDERGTLAVLAMDPAGYKVKGEVAGLLTFKAWALPALADKKLYLRDERHLVCVDLSKP